MKNKLLSAAFAFGLALTTASATAAESKRLISELPEDFPSDGVQISPDGNHVAYKLISGDKQIPVLDGKLQAPVDEIGEYFDFALKGGGVAYSIREGKQWKVVFNGQPGPGFEKVGDPEVNATGESVAYQAIQDNQHYLVVDGVKYGPYEGVLPPQFSREGKHLAYGIRQKGLWLYMIDGKPEKASFDRVDYFYFGKDPSRYAFGKSWTAVINGLRTPFYDDIGVFDFTPDLDLYSATMKDGEFYVWLGKPQKRYKNVGMAEVSTDGSAFAYEASDERGNFLVLGDREYPVPEAIGSILMSADGKEVWWVGTDFKVTWVWNLRDAKPQERPPSSAQALSPDGKRLAITFLNPKNNKNYVEIDGKAEMESANIGLLKFSPDSRHLAYFAKDGEMTALIVDGKKGKSWRSVLSIAPRFSDDGRTVQYVARDKGKIWLVENSLR